jgi:hypothetical protein
MKKNVALFLSVSLVISGYVPASASNQSSSDGVKISVNKGGGFGNQGFSYIDQSSTERSDEVLIGSYSRTCNVSSTNNLCAMPYQMAAYSLANLAMGPCRTSSQNFCIESIGLVEGSAKQSLRLIRETPGFTTIADPSVALPQGGTSSLWSENGLGTDSVKYHFNSNLKMQYAHHLKRFEPSSFSISIEPSITVSAAGATPFERLSPEQSPDGKGGWSARIPQICQVAEDSYLWLGYDECGLRGYFEPGTRFFLSVRIPNSVKGWFQSNLASPEYELQRSGKFQRLTVLAGPGETPVLNRAEYHRDLFAGNEESWIWSRIRNTTGAWSFSFDQFDDGALDTVENIASVVSNKSNGENLRWRIQSGKQMWSGSHGFDQCVRTTSGIVGIVNTNALAAQGTPPMYNKGFLNFSVSGLHFRSDGVTPYLGVYNMNIRQDFARCVYGLDSAPLSATIGFSTDSISTTSVGKKKNWLILSANGFTFSKKTIKVKITRAKR